MADNEGYDRNFAADLPLSKAKSWHSRLIRLGMVLLFLTLCLVALAPLLQVQRGPHRRTDCMNNLNNIARALLNYEQIHGRFPPAYTTDASGKPLHSWRTLILLQLDRPDLYKSIDFTKPWDDPANEAVFKQALHLFQCPGFDSNQENETTYLAVVTPNSCIRAGESRSISEVTDDPHLTLLVIEVDADHAVPWMRPVDADEELILSLSEKSRLSHSGGMVAAFVDGHVQFLPADLPAEERRALISITADDNAVIRSVD